MAEMKYKVVVFDLGETLMEYKGMHLSWDGYYQPAFEYVNQKLGLNLPNQQIQTSVQILKNYNPRIKMREKEIPAQKIFTDAVSAWNYDAASISLETIIHTFFESLKFEPVIYEDSIPALKKIRAANLKTAIMTDVASAMPDSLHKAYVEPLLPYFDLYVSSVTCGWRKPNPKGLSDIAAFFNSTPAQMIMIGDNQRDIQAAKNFGCTSVLMFRQNTPTPALGQNFTVHSALEAAELIYNSISGETFR